MTSPILIRFGTILRIRLKNDNYQNKRLLDIVMNHKKNVKLILAAAARICGIPERDGRG